MPLGYNKDPLHASTVSSMTASQNAKVFCEHWFSGHEDQALDFLAQQMDGRAMHPLHRAAYLKPVALGCKNDGDKLRRILERMQEVGFPLVGNLSGLATRQLVGYATPQALTTLFSMGIGFHHKECPVDIFEEASRNGTPEVAGIVVNQMLSQAMVPPDAAQKILWDGVNCIGAAAVIEALAAHQVPLDQEDARGNTALIVACSVFKFDMAEALLQHAANPNHANHQGVTPLMEAAALGSAYPGGGDAIRSLLKHGANPEAVDKMGKDAWSRATNPGVIEVLKEALAHVKAAHLDETTPQASGTYRVFRV